MKDPCGDHIEALDSSSTLALGNLSKWTLPTAWDYALLIYSLLGF